MDLSQVQSKDGPIAKKIPASASWRVQFLEVNGLCPVLKTLADLERQQPNEYKQITKSLRIAAQTMGICKNRNCIRKNTNSLHGEIYEAVAGKSLYRLMFFYDEEEKKIICTNLHVKKSKGKHQRTAQDKAFGECAMWKKLYDDYNRIQGENDG